MNLVKDEDNRLHSNVASIAAPLKNLLSASDNEYGTGLNGQYRAKDLIEKILNSCQ